MRLKYLPKTRNTIWDARRPVVVDGRLTHPPTLWNGIPPLVWEDGLPRIDTTYWHTGPRGNLRFNPKIELPKVVSKIDPTVPLPDLMHPYVLRRHLDKDKDKDDK